MVTACTTKFFTKNSHVLSTEWVCVFCAFVIANSDYFPTQLNWLVFITEVITALVELNLDQFSRSLWLAVHWSGRQSQVSQCEGPRFDSNSVHVRFVVDAVTVGQVFLRVFRFFSDSIIPLILHAHLHLHAALSCTTTSNGRSLAVFQKANLIWKLEWLNRKVLSLLSFKNLENLQIIHRLSVHLLIRRISFFLVSVKADSSGVSTAASY